MVRRIKTIGLIAFVFWLLTCSFLNSQAAEPHSIAQPILYRKVNFPVSVLGVAHFGQLLPSGKQLVKRTNPTESRLSLSFAGDLRIGDVNGDRQVDFVIARADSQGTYCSYFAAVDARGHVLWQVGQGGMQSNRPAPFALYDVDGDGADDVVSLFRKAISERGFQGMRGVELQIRDGRTGDIVRSSAPPAMQSLQLPDLTTAKNNIAQDWKFQRILVANFRGLSRPSDFCIKMGNHVFAFDAELNRLWDFRIDAKLRPFHPSYMPSVGDIDGDGKDEVFGGSYLINDDGTALWQNAYGHHMDSVAIAVWDDGKVRALCSGEGHVFDQQGTVVQALGRKLVPHGQEMRIADFDPDVPGPEMVLRNQGHRRDAILVSSQQARVLAKFRLNSTPNQTGMEAVYFHGPNAPALLYNGGQLWDAYGKHPAPLPDLPAPVGPAKMGWYHCIPANVCGDDGEELIVYNPWDNCVRIYTSSPVDESAFDGYKQTLRQSNVRLMD